ncbi:hypothetical protein BDZ88DRAFT_419280 [Geranomyces variabilis]|nr:hypothetical protein BDZ88DRAFT_419280 [Geranomyces variabilis]
MARVTAFSLVLPIFFLCASATSIAHLPTTHQLARFSPTLMHHVATESRPLRKHLLGYRFLDSKGWTPFAYDLLSRKNPKRRASGKTGQCR